MMKFILIEDDPRQSESIVNALKNRYSCDVVLCETVCEFLDLLAQPHPDSPCAVIADTMLTWDFPEDMVNRETPAWYGEPRGFCKAGMFCWCAFRNKESFRTVPWIYFTVLDEKLFAEVGGQFGRQYRDNRTRLVEKGPSIKPLFEEIAQLGIVDGPTQ